FAASAAVAADEYIPGSGRPMSGCTGLTSWDEPASDVMAKRSGHSQSTPLERRQESQRLRFVHFEEREDALRAMEKLDGTSIGNSAPAQRHPGQARVRASQAAQGGTADAKHRHAPMPPPAAAAYPHHHPPQAAYQPGASRQRQLALRGPQARLRASSNAHHQEQQQQAYAPTGTPALLLNAALFAVFIARSPQSIASEQRHPGCCDKMELIQQRLEMLERSLEEMKLSAPLKETAAGAKESYQPSIRKRRSAVESPSCTCPP
uniref:RRM domain-containing protein n=1 Tax=Macrostomum lignano TaxID=282301 RepID=A0A1I8F8Y6_9PLAT